MKNHYGLMQLSTVVVFVLFGGTAAALEPQFDARIDYPAGKSPQSVCSFDFDGDGDYDLAVTNTFTDSISVFENNGDGTFQTPAVYGLGDVYQLRNILAADFNGDGYLDFAISASIRGMVLILLNKGDGTFQEGLGIHTGRDCYFVVSGDFDNDDDYDLATCSFPLQEVAVYMNRGDASFEPADIYSVGGRPGSAFAADLDGDGNIDLATANADYKSVSVLTNDGAGSFSPSIEYGVGNSPGPIIGDDFDGDGYIDLATANVISNDISILFNLSDDITSIRDDLPSELPLGYSLAQSYPNPFNPEAVIEFTLPVRAEVSLDVFNILGRKVRTLMTGELSAGDHQLVWDGRNSSGKQVSSGVYLYRLTSGEYSATRKMVLVK